MLSNAVSHERTPWMESPRFWKWMMILEISAALLLPSNSKHTPGEILGLFGWLIAVIGVCLLGLWLAGRKSSFCDKWIQSNNLYLLSGVSLVLLISVQIIDFQTDINLYIPYWDSNTFLILKYGLFSLQGWVMGIAMYLLNRKWQHFTKTFALAYPLILCISCDYYTANIMFNIGDQPVLLLCKLAFVFYIFGYYYEPNVDILIKKEVRENWKWFFGSFAGLMITAIILPLWNIGDYSMPGIIYVYIYAIFLGARACAGERENHTYDYLAIRPIKLKTILGVKYKLGLIQVALLASLAYAFRPSLSIVAICWLFSFSFLISLLTTDILRASLLGFGGGILSLFGIALFLHQDFIDIITGESSISLFNFILFLAVMVSFVMGTVGMIQEGLQRKRLVWKSKNLVLILFSVYGCQNLFLLFRGSYDSKSINEYNYMYTLFVLVVFVIGVMGIIIESMRLKRLIWKTAYLGLIFLSLGLYGYGQIYYAETIKPVSTIPVIFGKYGMYLDSFKQDELHRVVVKSHWMPKDLLEMCIMDFSDPLNPVLAKPYYQLESDNYYFVNNTTLINVEFDTTGARLVVNDLSDLMHPRETFRKTLSRDTEIELIHLFNTREGIYYKKSKKQSRSYMFIDKMGLSPGNGIEIKTPKEKPIPEYLRINLNDYSDVQQVSKDRIDELSRQRELSKTLNENLIVQPYFKSSTHRYGIYDISDEMHPKLVYESPIYKQWINSYGYYLWGQWWSGMTIQGNYLYGCTNDDLLSICDIRDIRHPKPLGSIPWSLLDKVAYSIEGPKRQLVFYGHLVVVQYTQGFAIVDISNINKPVLLGKCNMRNDEGFLQGNYYYAYEFSGQDMYVFDLRKFIR